MDTMTINISMPKGLYSQTKRQAKKYHYNSVSEVIRDALRWWLNDKLTRNGFTPKFEEEVLRREKDMDKYDTVKWDGKTPFTQFVLNNPPKKRGKNRIRYQISDRSKGANRSTAGAGRRDQQMLNVV